MKFKEKILNLLGAVDKRHVSELSKRAFAMAQISRSTNDWVAFARSINYDIKSGGKLLRDRARDMAKNDPYAKKLLKMVRKNVIGPDGFTLRVKSGEYSYNPKTKTFDFELDKSANQLIQDAFWRWGNKKYCTNKGDLSFRELNQLVLSTAFQDGEIFVHHLKGKYNKYGYTIQLINADYCDEMFNQELPNGELIIMGIHYTATGKVKGYWFNKRTLKDELIYNYYSASEKVFIPAERISHVFIKEVDNQLRGVTQFAPAALRVKMLSGWDEASLIHARAAACTTGVLKPKENSNPDFIGYNKDSDNNVVQDLAPNEMFVVPDGYDFGTHDPKFPHEQHAPFNKSILKSVASGWDVSYHTLASDYEGVTWTSSRTALLDERDGWKDLQSWFVEHFLNDVYSNWLEMALLSGSIINPVTGNSLPIEKYEKFNEMQFIGRRWTWVDPEKEINANVKAVASFQSTLEKIVGEQGYEFEEIIDQIAREQAYIKDKLGIDLISVLNKIPTEPVKETPEENNNNGNGNGKAKRINGIRVGEY